MGLIPGNVCGLFPNNALFSFACIFVENRKMRFFLFGSNHYYNDINKFGITGLELFF